MHQLKNRCISNMNLYELDNSIIELLENGFNDAAIDLDTGEIDFEKASLFLDDLQLERKAKLENIALYIKNLESEADAIKQEEQNLEVRRKAKEKKADQLREYIKNSMLMFNELKFETPKVAMSFRTSKVVEVDEQILDKQYYKEKIEYSVDKKAIKEAIENGIEVLGAGISERKNLQIK